VRKPTLPVQSKLSKAAREKRKPLPPADLMGAKHDSIILPAEIRAWAVGPVKEMREALEFVKAGWLNMEPECKTVGYGPPRVGHNHCLSCWYHAARSKAAKALHDSSGETK
jgi:hypothetical protein